MLTYKAKQNVLASLHELTKQNTKQRSAIPLAKSQKSQHKYVHCFKNKNRVGILSWVGKNKK